jgi:hypothetical protein
MPFGLEGQHGASRRRAEQTVDPSGAISQPVQLRLKRADPLRAPARAESGADLDQAPQPLVSRSQLSQRQGSDDPVDRQTSA